MKTWLIGALVVAMAAALAPDVADAKRLGGGKSTGMQRDMPARTAPDAAPAKPAAPAQGAAPQGTTAGAAAGATGAAGATAAAGKRSWLGPVAGLAAGLGLAALASHLGFGEELASMMLIGLAVMAALALFAFLRRRSGAARGPALAGAGAGAGSAAPPMSWPTPDAPAGQAPAQGTERRSLDAAAPARSSAAGAQVTQAFVPAAFDAEGFERIARMIFVRMQAANDAANLDDLRQFTTPEMFAELKLDLMDRGAKAQTTEVKQVEARVLDVAEEADRQVVSVRYRGEVIEAAGEPPAAFDEVWHLVRPRSEGAGWAIAGIEQMR